MLFAGFILLCPRIATAEASGVVDTAENRIIGYWQRGAGEAIIEVRRHADGYHGVIVMSERRPETVGIVVFRELRYDAETGSWHGRAYSIKRNREVPIDILVPKLDELELTAHILVFKKRVDFRRIPDTEATGIQLADR